MATAFTVSSCALPVAGGVCFSIGGAYYVTAQPIYVWPSVSPYPIIAQAGIKTVLSVRDPQEIVLPLPVDLTEVPQLITNGVATTTVPLPHIAMSQAQFNQQAYNAATVIQEWTEPILIHCSTGDRASAAFAAFLITYAGFSNANAITFAKGLALQNAQFINYLEAYQPP